MGTTTEDLGHQIMDVALRIRLLSDDEWHILERLLAFSARPATPTRLMGRPAEPPTRAMLPALPDDILLYAAAGEKTLTPREREVLALIMRGYSNKEAARLLHISPRTVEVHRGRVMQKLGARNASHLFAIALTLGLGSTLAT